MRSNRLSRVLVLVSLAAALVCTAAAGAFAQTVNTWSGKPAKYVFLFIGDGMGIPQINAAEAMLEVKTGSRKPGVERLALSSLPVQGMTTTYSANSYITDSAPAATSLASGYKTDNGVIGMDPSKRIRYKSIAEMAHEKGFKVGIVTSVSLDHATPASFYAHQPSRKDYYEISRQLADSGFEYFAGGGFVQPQGKKKDQPSSIEYAKSKGYFLVNNKRDFLNLKKGTGKVLVFNPVLDEDAALPYAMDRGGSDMSLAELTEKGIELLENPKGFFMMVEGGKIDWACHANDAAASIQDTLAFDEAVRKALAFAGKHPGETLVVVTGDHECGGMSIGFAGTQYDSFFEKLLAQKGSFQAFDAKLAAYKKSHTVANGRLEDVLPLVESFFGLKKLDGARKKTLEKLADLGDRASKDELALALSPREMKALEEAFRASLAGNQAKGDDESAYLIYGGYEPFTITLTHILNNKAGIGWTSYSHTGVPVPVFVSGRGQEIFGGYYDNTDVAKKIMAVMGFNPSFASR